MLPGILRRLLLIDTDEFATYNNHQNNIGYEVYDSIEYGEDMYIATLVYANIRRVSEIY